jgi:hypothetical protein
MTNKQFSKNDTAFLNHCKAAKTPATKRQASKYRNKKGLAYGIKSNNSYTDES